MILVKAITTCTDYANKLIIYTEDGRCCRKVALSWVAQNMSAISRGTSALAVFRPIASRRTCLVDIQWSVSAQAKFASSISCSFHNPAVTQHVSYFKGTIVVNESSKS